MIFPTNRYENQSATNSSILQSNLLSPIGQPYSAELCNYGPMYHHSHNLLHNYNPVYGKEKNIRQSSGFSRPMYTNYPTLYSTNGNLRNSSSLYQNSYDFSSR